MPKKGGLGYTSPLAKKPPPCAKNADDIQGSQWNDAGKLKSGKR